MSLENVLWFEMKFVTLHSNSVPDYWAKFKNIKKMTQTFNAYWWWRSLGFKKS